MRLSEIRQLVAEDIYSASEDHFAPLQHELSAHMEARNGERARMDRTSAEVAALTSGTTWRAESCFHNLQGFGNLLLTLNQHVAPESRGWRMSAIGLRADIEGARVQFPPVTAVPALIENSSRIVNREDYPLIVRAALVHAAVLNAHPFTDGNGRTARMVANLILRSGTNSSSAYIPFYEIAVRARGGHEIALRQAEIFGRWEPLIAYFCNVIHLSLALGR